MADNISRGEIISLLAGLPAAVAVTTAAASAATDDSGGTKKQYKYQLKPGPKGQKCGGCSLFKAPGSCLLVKGKISPNGYCIAYSPKAH
jgi:hypothetical protein